MVKFWKQILFKHHREHTEYYMEIKEKADKLSHEVIGAAIDVHKFGWDF